MKQKNLDMTQGNPIRLIILFSIPMLIGSIFQLMYNMADTVVVGRYVGKDALAAIGATSSTTAFLLYISQGLTNAVSVVISQAAGKKDERRIRDSVGHAAYLVLAGAVVLGATALFGARPMMKLLGTPDGVIDQSVAYIQITGGLIIAQVTYNGVASILRAIGDSKTPLYFLIFCSILNILLDLAFVLWLDGGVVGVAVATVMSQGLSAVLCIIYMFRRHEMLRPDRAAFKLQPKLIREYLRLGLPMCVQSAFLSVGMFVITAVINSYGEDIMAAYTIGSKVEQLATISFSNVAFSFSVYAGQNFGAKAYDRIRDGLKKGLMIIGGLALLSTAVMLIFASPLARLFAEDNAENALALEGAVNMVRIEAIFFVALGAIWTVNSTLRGLGAVKMTMISSILELVMKIGVSVVLPMFIDATGIWVAAPTGWVLGIIPSAVYLLWWFKKKIPAAV